MAYVALYRKWRPAGFAEVKGQDAVVSTLKNQVAADRIGHAYLFCGSRGTGKTSVAKIFAKAVNCADPKDGEPCGVCPMCTAIQAGSSVNVIEIDAASNNGVDNIREIREETQYRPAEGRFRVYIIDEVHMLSSGAFNALLKTLEEPPSYVIFILATTEPHKIPLTVLSRCQRYDFRRITPADMEERLRELAEREGVEAEPAALSYIARRADGAMRDAISLFDQCISFRMGESLTYEKVLKALGTVDSEVLSELLRALLADDTTAALGCIEKVRLSGRDLGRFVQDLVWYLRNLLLLMTARVSAELLEISEEDWTRLREEGRRTSPEELMRYIRLFSALMNEMRGAADKRVLLEVAVIRATRPAMEEDLSALEDRVFRLERRVKEGIAAAPALQKDEAPAEKEKGGTQTVRKISRANWEDLQAVRKNWKKLLAALDYARAKSLENIWLEPKDGGVFSVVFPNHLEHNMALHFGTMDALAEKVKEVYGKEISFDCRVAAEKETAPHYITEEEISRFPLEIETEDE